MRASCFSLVTAILFVPFAPASAAPNRDKEVDKAIDKALEFLWRSQDNDGAWRLGAAKNPASTSLAVMAFLSAGHVPGEGRYGDTVEKGVRWVLRHQQSNGLFSTAGSYEMYTQGICTLMLSEAAGMTEGKLAEEVRQKLEKAVEVILRAQRTTGIYKGGWRYQAVGIDADMSVTGWQLMALRAAKNLGCDVPPESIDQAVDYLKRSQDPVTGGFRYHPGSHVTIPCTGTGILGLELCGKARHHSPETLKAGDYLIKNTNLPRWNQAHFFYSVYYGSQATFQLGDKYWSYFRPQLHEVLLKNQSSNGSWGAGASDGHFGPAYGTSMAVLALTVEYRYLPIYQRGEEPTDKK